MLKSLAFIVIASYAGLTAVLWLLQEKILFHPVPVTGRPAPPKGWTSEPVRLAARDGTRLAGVLVRPPPGSPPVPLLIYFGGNAEESTAWSSTASEYGPRALLLMNYRGYGESEGSPSERALVSDALEIFDAMAKRTDIDAARIALVGCSLGSGVAVQVAAHRPVKAVVLTSPFDSVRDVAVAVYPYLPVRWLVRHPFDSAALAPHIKVPALVVIGTADTVIRPAHSKRLASLWGGPVETVELQGLDHNDIVGPEYMRVIRGFLDRHL